MNLDRRGRELIRWPVTGAPEDAALEVSLDDGTTWHALTRDGEAYTALVAGPDATDNPPGTIVAVAGRNRATVRALDDPEAIYRTAGTIDVH